jgi:hypothetical protein
MVPASGGHLAEEKFANIARRERKKEKDSFNYQNCLWLETLLQMKRRKFTKDICFGRSVHHRDYLQT